MKSTGIANVTQADEFDEIIDVRSPAEFAEDHMPGAVNCPVLSNEERARVGTLYKQDSPFAAKKIGAALVARNIAGHIETRFLDKPRTWRPLVYCWRGGKRSGAMAHVLRQIGWHASTVEGGYKSYRRHVVAELSEFPRKFSYRVVTGATGSGKSRLLEALAAQGAQVLDLEALAAHKGSVLGGLPGKKLAGPPQEFLGPPGGESRAERGFRGGADMPQPSQKMFESRLLAVLQRLTFAEPVFVEAESRKIGALQVPDALLEAMRASPCLRIEATDAARVAFLIGDYDYFLADPASLKEKLDCLRELQSGEVLSRWNALIDARDWPALVGELLELHYDPLYRRSQGRNYVHFVDAPRFETDDLSPSGLRALAGRVLASGS
ncbi:MAG: tRNA 2-selenouridine(34) synthase MnmH [Rhodocyclaceae bacterium]|nr:tRNA 2-selenouridine(34) synthase MnmH [Rhodocyclaceae bacterium]